MTVRCPHSTGLCGETNWTFMKHQHAERRLVWQAAHASAFIPPEHVASIPAERIAELQALEDASKAITKAKAANAKTQEPVPTAGTASRRRRAKRPLDPPLSIFAVIRFDVSAL